MGANRMPASCFLNPNIFIINSHIPITALVQLHFPIGCGGRRTDRYILFFDDPIQMGTCLTKSTANVKIRRRFG